MTGHDYQDWADAEPDVEVQADLDQFYDSFPPPTDGELNEMAREVGQVDDEECPF